MPAFDYVILGAGVAGCVLANRISEDPRTEVPLVGAGPPARGPYFAIPMMGAGLFEQRTDNPNPLSYEGHRHSFVYQLEPYGAADKLNERWVRGKAVGGSTAINGFEDRQDVVPAPAVIAASSARHRPAASAGHCTSRSRSFWGATHAEDSAAVRCRSARCTRKSCVPVYLERDNVGRRMTEHFCAIVTYRLKGDLGYNRQLRTTFGKAVAALQLRPPAGVHSRRRQAT